MGNSLILNIVFSLFPGGGVYGALRLSHNVGVGVFKESDLVARLICSVILVNGEEVKRDTNAR